MIPEEMIPQVSDSIASYANSIRGKGVREILRSRFVPPSTSTTGDDWLNTNDPHVKKAVDFWKEAMRDWEERYGDVDGWVEYNAYWNSVAAYQKYGAISEEEKYYGYKWEELRDSFGYAGSYTLWAYRPEAIADRAGY